MDFRINISITALALGVVLACCFSNQANAQQAKAKKQALQNQKQEPDKKKAVKKAQAPKQKKRNPVMAPIEDVAGLPRVLLIGDSISIGYTLQVRKALKGKANVHRPPTNCGPTSRGVESIDQWLGDKKWDVIHFNFGLHDLKYLGPNGENLQNPNDPKNHQQVPPKEYEKNLRKIVERLQKTKAKLVWRNTTPVPEGAKGRVVGDSDKYNAIAAKVMKDNGIEVHDMYASVKPKMAELMQPKGNVHFNKGGCEILGQEVAAVILKAFGS